VSSDAYRTVRTVARCEIPKIKGSRFAGSLWPLAAEEAVGEHLAALRKELPGAGHHCWAWRLGREGEHFRCSDDGEPKGSAGRPILQRIDGAGLTGVLLVVSRVFGGTKLGVGGLVSAYGAAAAAVLGRARVVTVVITRRLRVRHPYECSGAVHGLLAAMQLAAFESEFGAEVSFRVEVPDRRIDEFRRELAERTAGRGSVAAD
jgi:uncharacterized YigZ family protein